MKPVKTRKATGVLAEMMAQPLGMEYERTKKRMMLAAKIADAVRSAGYTQKEFAKRMGKSETVISEWLSGGRNFTVDTLSDIEETLGIHLLDVSIMTIVDAGAEIRQSIPSNAERYEPLANNDKWRIYGNKHILVYTCNWA